MEKRQTRLELNRKIVKIISDLVEANMDWRFGQILSNFDIATHFCGNDIFFEEPDETLCRIESTLHITTSGDTIGENKA